MEILIVFLLLQAVLHGARSAIPCHHLCTCIWRNGKELVHCNGKELVTIPTPIDVATQLLHLEDNAIRYLTAKIFVQRGLYNLQGIFLQTNNMEQIDAKAFEGLENLVDLDMSNNKLGIVPSDALSHISGLRELKLNNNPITRIGRNAFVALKELFRLELSDCLLKYIDEKAFRGLIKLQWLRLDNNKLKMLPANSLMPLNSIREVELHSNPWSCDCLIRYLKQWLEQLNPSQQQQPLCASPSRLLGAPIGSVSLSEFSCLPTIRHNVIRHNVWIGENVTLVCAVSASPEARVGWLWDNHGILNGSVTTGGTRYLIYTHGSEEKTSLLTVIDAEEDVAGRYTCQARNSAGTAVSHFRVSVSERQAVTHVTFRMDSVVLVVILVGVVVACVLLSLCICMIFIKRRRRDAKFSSFDLDQFASSVPNNEIALMAKEGNCEAWRGSESYSDDSYGDLIVPGNNEGPSRSHLEESQIELHSTFNPSLQMEPNSSIRPFSRQNLPRDMESDTICRIGADLENSSDLVQFADDSSKYNFLGELGDSSLFPDNNKYFYNEEQITSIDASYHHANNDKNNLEMKHLTFKYDGVTNGFDTHAENIFTNRLPSKSSSFNFTELQALDTKANDLLRIRNNNSLNRYDSMSCTGWSTSANNDFTDNSFLRGRSKPKANSERKNSYVYHNVQLDKYIQKYEALQEKFDQMKRSCESVCSVSKPTRTLPRIPCGIQGGSSSVINEETKFSSRNHLHSEPVRRNLPYKPAAVKKTKLSDRNKEKLHEQVIQC